MTSNVYPLRKPATQIQLRIELAGVTPCVWRVVLVPESIALDRLNRVIQIAMGWENTHLHEFTIAMVRYGVPDPEFDVPGSVISEKGVALSNALGNGSRFSYTYDFGDDWEHTLTIEERGIASDSPTQIRCLAGENACPPEDVGGPRGYAEFIRAITDTSHDMHEEMLEWLEGSFDPRRFDLVGANKRLKRLRV